MKGLGIVVSLVTLGAAGLILYDIMFSKRCHHIIPIFDMLDTFCLMPGALGGGGPQLGQKAGLLMDPTKVGDMLRGAQRSADIKYNQSVSDALRDAMKRTNQPVKSYTVPPGAKAGPNSPGTSQAVKPGTAKPSTGSSGAPRITTRGGASPFSFDNFVRALTEAIKGPRTPAEWAEWMKKGGGAGELVRPGGIRGGLRVPIL